MGDGGELINESSQTLTILIPPEAQGSGVCYLNQPNPSSVGKSWLS